VAVLADRAVRLVPIVRERLADLETPVSAFAKLRALGGAFLLESAEGGERMGRFSFIGIAPRAALTFRGGRVSIEEAGAVRDEAAPDPLASLRSYMSRFRRETVPGLPRLSGGAVGFVSYELARAYERIPLAAEDPHGLPDAFFAVYDTIVDVPSTPGSPAFRRFYNSTDSGGADLSGGWRHAFSRTITPKYAGMQSMTYVSSADTSSLYGDEATACTSGFREIKSQVSTWQNATASYANGVCTLKVAGTSIGTLDLIYSLPSTLTPGMTLIGFDATRDDGQLIGG